MNKALPRILVLVSLFVLASVALSLLSNIAQLANLAENALPGAGQIVFWCLVLVFAGLLLTPLVIYFKLPKPLIPPGDDSAAAQELYQSALRVQLTKNPLLADVQLDTNDQIPAALTKLGAEADKIIKDSASAVFVTSATSARCLTARARGDSPNSAHTNSRRSAWAFSSYSTRFLASCAGRWFKPSRSCWSDFSCSSFHCGQPLSFSAGVSKMPRSGGLHWRIRFGMLG